MTPVLMVALVPLSQQSLAGPLPKVAAGQVFWASSLDQAQLIAGGLARNWVTGDPPAPQVEPPYTVNGVPGLAKGTTNASH